MVCPVEQRTRTLGHLPGLLSMHAGMGSGGTDVQEGLLASLFTGQPQSPTPQLPKGNEMCPLEGVRGRSYALRQVKFRISPFLPPSPRAAVLNLPYAAVTL